VGGESGCHLWVGWGRRGQPGCGDSTSLRGPLPFPAEPGWENASHGKPVPGREMLTGSRGLPQLRLCPLSPCPALPRPSGCHRAGMVRCSVTGEDEATRGPPRRSCRAGVSPGAECRLARGRACNPLTGAPALRQALAAVNPRSRRERGLGRLESGG